MNGRLKLRVAYIQYTNPAGYPPLEHSSRLLAEQGWQVLFLGAAAHGADSLSFPPHPSIKIERLGHFGRGLAQRINYAGYIGWVVARCLVFRPDWIYASDPIACPAALAARAAVGSRSIYHEHDSPADAGAGLSRLQRVIRRGRQRMADLAELCVLPQAQRLEAFVASTGRTGPTRCVWNCPRLDEVRPPRSSDANGRGLVFHYHGSLNAERLPFTVVEALARSGDSACLTVIGYETIGSRGYVAELMSRASRLGVERRVRVMGPQPRLPMLDAAAASDVGLAFMPPNTNDVNMTFMTGASNKPFDYLAVGQMLLVSDLPDWRQMFVQPGYAMACNPYDVESLASAMRWCVDNPDLVLTMGEHGRQRISSEWNYERCFQPVLEEMCGGGNGRKGGAVGHGT